MVLVVLVIGVVLVVAAVVVVEGGVVGAFGIAAEVLAEGFFFAPPRFRRRLFCGEDLASILPGEGVRSGH